MPDRAGWTDRAGVIALPSGIEVRGRPLGRPASPADFALVLADGPVPDWPFRRIRWPDFGVPADSADALDALREAHQRARAGQRVEAACHGGVGRTGTALAALAVLDGLTPGEAVGWVRAGYHPRAIETRWQRRWLRRVVASGRPAGASLDPKCRSARMLGLFFHRFRRSRPAGADRAGQAADSSRLVREPAGDGRPGTAAAPAWRADEDRFGAYDRLITVQPQ